MPRHYIGTAAEIAGITGGAGDTAYSTDTDVYYHWCGASWVVGGIPYFVERLAANPDFNAGNFTCDGNPHANGLDLSVIVPPGAFVVLLSVGIADDVVGTWLDIMRNAAPTQNKISTKILVANSTDSVLAPVSIDADRLMDYQASAVVFLGIEVTVLGWWIRRCL